MTVDRRVIPILAMLALSAVAGRPAGAGMIRGYALGDGGASLVRFDADSPGSAQRVAFFGGDDRFLDAIDFRPATGELYGYRSQTATYYTVNLDTGVLTAVSAPDVGATTNTFFLGMDFNPTIDRLRVVTDSDQNLVYNPNTGTATAVTSLFYGSGDTNEGMDPRVIDNAYTQSFAGATTTQQYVLDYGLNLLATLNNNAGTLATVGNVTLDGNVLDFDEYTGFDIYTSASGMDTAYALLTVGGTAGFYRIDLSSGAATSIGGLPSADLGPIYSLSVTAVPEPSSLALAGIGGLSLMVVAARRRFRKHRESD